MIRIGKRPSHHPAARRFPIVVHRQMVAAILLALSSVLATNAAVFAQNLQDLFGQESGALSAPRPSAPTTVTTTLTPAAENKNEVELSIRLDMPPGAYTYSQNPSFGGATKIAVTEVFGLEPVGDSFVPDHQPQKKFEELLGQEIEKFADQVTWSRRFRLTGAAPLDQVSVAGELKYQICDANSCTPLSETFEVFVGGEVGAPASDGDSSSDEASAATDIAYGYVVRPVRAKPDPLTLQFELSPANAQPGETVTLAVTMALEDDWHTFGLVKHEKQVSNPTELALTNTDNLRPLTDFAPVTPPEVVKQDFDDITENVHHGTVTWTQTFEVIAAGPYGVSGKIDYQICKTSCMTPKVVPFSLGSLQQPDDIASATPASKTFVPVAAAQPGQGIDDILNFQLESSADQASLPWYLLMAFLGGLILNIMPCVLPVLAIKVMSFVQQAGESRGRVLLLNICYSLGVIGVFLVLATLAVTLQFGWGGLFQKPEFNLAMIAIVFAMGLSMLGVFEIPIPGMVGSASGQHREGLPGAFATGIFATLLATPCSGPLMGSALAWSVKQSAPIVYLVWGVMGLGMASPYLMVGLFPGTIKFLPKPGMWMVRFKEFSGFALIAAAIWLMSAMSPAATIPILIMLFGLALGVWMIGALYDHASPQSRKMLVRVAALLVVGAVGLYGYRQYETNIAIASAASDGSEPSGGEHGDGQLPWETFSTTRLSDLVKSGKPVLVDFTASWCINCKVNEKVALNTVETEQFLQDHGVVPLYADFSDYDPEIQEWLDRFNQMGVPLTVIFPADNPLEPIIMTGVYSQSKLLDNLKSAVAKDVAANAASLAADRSPQ